MAVSSGRRLVFAAVTVAAMSVSIALILSNLQLVRQIQIAREAADQLERSIAKRGFEPAHRTLSATATGEMALTAFVPKHARLMRMLSRIAADRRRFGPADPDKVNVGYAFAAMGFHPERFGDSTYVQAYQKIKEYEIASEDTAFFLHRGYSDAQAHRLANLLAATQISPGEASAVALSQGMTDEQASVAAQAASAEIQKEIDDLVGSEDRANLATYNLGQNLAAQIQRSLAGSGNDLSVEQYVGVASIFGREPPRSRLEGTISTSGFAAASALLTPQQTAALSDYLTVHSD